MPFWIQGWMEVTTDSPADSTAIWQAVVDLGVLIDTSDQISEQLFGLSRDFRSDRSLRKSSLFADRGVPAVRSRGMEMELKGHRELAEQHGRNAIGIGGYTFASYEEILASCCVDNRPNRSEWWLVFRIADLLIQSQRHTRPNSIHRLVQLVVPQ